MWKLSEFFVRLLSTVTVLAIVVSVVLTASVVA